MTTITFNGGPFDGETRAVDMIAEAIACIGCVLRSDAIGSIADTRYVVYLPDGRGGVVFHAYADSLHAGLAMLPKENRR